jgi:hypothetical protein
MVSAIRVIRIFNHVVVTKFSNTVIYYIIYQRMLYLNYF